MKFFEKRRQHAAEKRKLKALRAFRKMREKSVRKRDSCSTLNYVNSNKLSIEELKQVKQAVLQRKIAPTEAQQLKAAIAQTKLLETDIQQLKAAILYNKESQVT